MAAPPCRHPEGRPDFEAVPPLALGAAYPQAELRADPTGRTHRGPAPVRARRRRGDSRADSRGDNRHGPCGVRRVPRPADTGTAGAAAPPRPPQPAARPGGTHSARGHRIRCGPAPPRPPAPAVRHEKRPVRHGKRPVRLAERSRMGPDPERAPAPCSPSPHCRERRWAAVTGLRGPRVRRGHGRTGTSPDIRPCSSGACCPTCAGPGAKARPSAAPFRGPPTLPPPTTHAPSVTQGAPVPCR